MQTLKWRSLKTENGTTSQKIQVTTEAEKGTGKPLEGVSLTNPLTLAQQNLFQISVSGAAWEHVCATSHRPDMVPEPTTNPGN